MTPLQQMLASFTGYCEKHPDQRFWQALRNWSGHNYILVSYAAAPPVLGMKDTFGWVDKNESTH